MRGWSVFACTLVLSSGCECGTEPGLPDGSLPDGQVPPGSEVHAEIQISPDVIPDGDNFTTSVTLDGTGSTVGPGATIRYAWMIGDGQLAEGTLEDGRIVATFPGDNAVTVALTVTDGAASDTATATIRVDRPPEAILRPASGFAGEAIALDASRSFDREGQPLSFSWSLVEGDPSATITGDAGTASFRSDIPGDYVVRVAVSDGTSTAEADAQVVVIPRPDAQIPWDVQVTATPPRLSPGTPTRLDVTVAGASPSDPLDVEIRVEGAVISMGTARSTMFTPTSAGEHRVVADVTGLGRAGRGRTRVFAASGPDDGAPTVSLSTPGADAVLTTSEIARGTAHDGDLAAYYLEARATDSSGAWIELHRGTSSVNGGDLGPVDVTRMAGFSAFDLRLRAVDAWGNEAMTPPRRIYLSAGETGEVGNLRFGVSDAEIRLSGFPLRLTRTYDSYDAREADFGQNWSMSLDYEEMETHTDGPLGEGWSFDANLCIFGGSGPPDERAHVITVRIGPNLLAYEFTPEFDGCITGLQYFTARFRPIGVSPGTFEVAGDGVRLGLRSGTNQLEYLDSFDVPNGRVFDPTDFALVVDGQRASFEDGRLASVTDRQGNGLTFADDGVTHTSGARLAFVRDAGHRITRVTRPDGRERTYQYNAVGELIAATDWDGRTTRYFYGPDHHLWRILDPRGAVVFDARYDDEGRLEQLYGAGGDGFTQEVDRESGRLVVTHADGSTTVQEFDETGRLTREVGRDGRERTLAYDTDGRTTRRTEDGVTATYRYDPQGNVQFATVGGQPEVELVRTNGRLDALRSGGSSTLELMRTPDGLLTGYRSSAGEVDFGYDARGDLDALSVPGSDALMIARDGYGHPDSMRFGDLDVDIDASEVGDVEAIRFMHDGRMHEIHAEYDGEGRPVAITAMVDGAMVRDERIVTDADGERMRRGDLDTVRDAQGRVTHRLTPDGSGYSIAYDVGGRPARMTSPSGRVTQLDYRPADGVVRRISPTGLIEITTLDAEGRVSAVETGGVTRRYGYDAAGRLHTVTGPDGQDTVLDYDDSGRPVRMELPDGTVLEDIYTNGVLTERRRDGTTMTTLSYAPTGEVSGIASAMGVAIDVEYDPLGEVSAVSAPGLGTTSYEHDAGGLTAIVDGEGRRTEIARAALGTETTTTLPSGRTYRAFHDPMSGESVSVLPDGASVRTLLDGRSRPTAITADDGTTATFTYDRDGEIASLAVAGREVNLTYDAEGRFVQILESDGRVVRYAYERTFGHLDTLTTPGGADTFLYDADGALDGVVTAAGPTVMVSHRAPGGAPTAWTVGPITITADAPHGGDATVRVESGGAVRFEERYGYDTDQRVSAITRPGGVSSTFHYDGLNRLVQEERASGAITFGYDRASNLVSREVDGASASFSVDVDDRLTQGDGETFDYDERGRLVAIHGGRDITLGYDGLDRLVHVETSGSLGAHRIDYGYDAQGLLVSRTEDGVERRFAWDRSSAVPQIIEEYAADGTLLARTTRVGPTIVRAAGGQTYVMVTDGLSNVRTILGSDGSPVATRDYTPYGRLRGGDAPTLDLPFGFGGEWTDPTTGLVFLRSRHYDPRTGRFLTRDTADPELMSPVTLNRYLYANAAPTLFVDPMGTWSLGGMLVSIAVRTAMFGYNFLHHPAVNVATRWITSAIAYDKAKQRLPASGLFNHIGEDPFRLIPTSVVVGGSVAVGFLGAWGGMLSQWITGNVSALFGGSGEGFSTSRIAGAELLMQLHGPYAFHVMTYLYQGSFTGGGSMFLGHDQGFYGGLVWDAPVPDSYNGDFDGFSAPAPMFVAGLLDITGNLELALSLFIGLSNQIELQAATIAARFPTMYRFVMSMLRAGMLRNWNLSWSPSASDPPRGYDRATQAWGLTVDYSPTDYSPQGFQLFRFTETVYRCQSVFAVVGGQQQAAATPPGVCSVGAPL